MVAIAFAGSLSRFAALLQIPHTNSKNGQTAQNTADRCGIGISTEKVSWNQILDLRGPRERVHCKSEST